MLISEIFCSRQGEGSLTGTLSVFVRFSGCNLRCRFCDTPYTSWEPDGRPWSLDEIIRSIEHFDAQHVVVTGGEPMLAPELPDLCSAVRRTGRHVTIETAGTIFRDVDCDLMSISPKLSNSTPSQEQAGSWRARHERSRHRPDVVCRLTSAHEYQLKFVVDSPADVAEIESYLMELPEVDRARVWLMPQGIAAEALCEKEAWLTDVCAKSGLQLCSRKQIEWYGHTRGT